jgi:hypothetical protein
MSYLVKRGSMVIIKNQGIDGGMNNQIKKKKKSSQRH